MLALAAGLAAPAGAHAQAAAGQSAAVAAVADAPDRVINMILAKVNGAPIFLTDLEEELDNQLALLRTQFPEEEIEAQLPDMRLGMLASLIDDQMMVQRADQLGITADANAVDRALQNLREANGLTDDAEFETALSTVGLTREDLREQTRKQIRQQQLVIQEVQRNLVVAESEIAAYYSEHPEEFSAPEQVRLEQLVFLGGPELQAQAVAALAQLRAGASLDEVAASHPAATVFPADEIFINVDDLSTSLAAVVPGLAEGVYSEPIQSQFGWHVVRVAERRLHQVQPLDEVRDAIRQRLTGDKSQKRLQEYLAQLRERTHVLILAPEYASVEELWKTPEEEQQPPSRN